MSAIGKQDGIKAAINRLRDLDPSGTMLKKTGGSWPDISTLPPDLDSWKAWDKLQRTLQILKDDHDADDGEDIRPPVTDLASAQQRMFLAQAPLDCLSAGTHMVPVCTADLGYRDWYTADVIAQLRARFGTVESWCDCRDPTAYSEALKMAEDFGLDGAWGQCETTSEFDHAYANGARRLVGSINAQVMDDARLAKVASGEVLVTVELYRNKQPNLQPDYRNANAGIGGNCIACYESADEGASYYPVSRYKQEGYYRSGIDSIYAVGLKPEDWKEL